MVFSESGKAALVAGLDDLVGEAGANGITTGEQAGAGWGAEIGRSVVVGGEDALLGHASYGGSGDGATEGLDVAVSHVVGEDDDEVSLWRVRLRGAVAGESCDGEDRDWKTVGSFHVCSGDYSSYRVTV